MRKRDWFHLSHRLVLAVVVVSLLTALIPTSAANADSVVAFPDPNLQAAIREAIGKPSGDIYESDLVGLYTLNAPSRGIYSLSGLEHCTDLMILDLDDNLISAISPLAGLTNLFGLELAGNYITNITPLAGLTGLNDLDLAYMEIGDISPLATLTGLSGLYLDSNQISDITPLAGLTGLRYLGLAYMEISDISPLATLANLTSLWLQSNQISDISAVDNLTALTSLSLGSNQIGDISPLSGLTNLMYLDLDSNQISDISAVDNLTALTGLQLGGNQISDISAVEDLTALTGLYLGGNQISDISAVDNLTGLTSLLLQDNQIANVSPLGTLTGLKTLWLQNNQIANVSALASLTGLTNLLLYDNQISDISSLFGLTSLTYLDLNSNQISDIQPLVNNVGMASGDSVALGGNPLSSTSLHIYIPALEERGVTVYRDPHDSVSPVQPSNDSPDNGAAGVGLTPLLQSSAFSDPDTGDTHKASQWQIAATAGNYSSPVFDSGTDASHLTSIVVPSGRLNYSATYYWRVRYQDVHWVWSEWSSETSFSTVANQPPVRPSNVSPVNAATSTSLTPTLQSSAFSDANDGDVHGASQWQVTIASGNYASPILDSGTDAIHLTSIDVPSPSLQYATTYYWRVRYRDNYDAWSDWSAETSFTTSMTAPSVLTGDAGDITVESGRLNGDLASQGTAGSVMVSFVWGMSSGSYPNETTGQTMTGTGAFFFDLAGLDPGTTCYYRAKAVGHGDPVYGDEKSFATGRSPEVHAVDPVQGKRKQHLTVTITGANLEGATGVSFGSEITVGDFSVSGSSEITVEIAIDARAAKGMRDVSVTTRWGTARKTGGFSVVGGGGGICSGGALASPGAPSEMTAVLAALGGLFTVGYWIVRKSAKERTEPARSGDA